MYIITCLQTIRRNCCKFTMTVQKCMCSILQLVLFQFDQFHQYLYIILIIYFSSIWYSERYRDIVWNISTPFQKVSDIYCSYYYYDFIYLAIFIIITYYWVSMLKYISSTKNKKQNRRGTICNTGCEHWTLEKIEVQANHWERDWFSVVNRPVLLWISWSGTVTNQS